MMIPFIENRYHLLSAENGVFRQSLVRLSQVPKLLPPNPVSGKKLHIATVYRWVQRGRNGRKLETVKIGGTQYTSFEAIRRFAVATQQSDATPSTTALDTPVHLQQVTPAKRQRRQQQVRDRLRVELGVSPGIPDPGMDAPAGDHAA